MIDIVFNGKTYPVDESIYNEAKNQIKEHLATTMNGTGAVINFDGVDYNVSSTKLNEVAEELVEYLSTELSGTGAIIVINGVSYPVDAGKLESTKDIFDNALTELENIGKSLAPGLYRTGAITIYENGDHQEAAAMLVKSWEDLETEGSVAISEGNTEIVLPEQRCEPPVMNEYGFYYGIGYSMGTSVMAIFNEDTSAIAMMDGETTEIPAGLIVYSDHLIDMSAIGYGTAVVSEDGEHIEFAALDGMILTTNLGVYRSGVYCNIPYSGTGIGTIIFNSDGSISTCNPNGTTAVAIPASAVIYGDNTVDLSLTGLPLILEVSEDGTQLSYEGEVALTVGYDRPPKGTVYVPGLDTAIDLSDPVPDVIQGDLVLPSDGRAVTIKSNGFYKQHNLSSILLPDSITEIESSAFYECSSLRSITIPANVHNIGSSAFYGCSNLMEVINKSNLNIVAGDTANGDVAYYAKEVHNGATKIINQDYCLFYTENDTHYLVDYAGSSTEAILPQYYRGQPYQIRNFTSPFTASFVYKVVIPDTVTAICAGAFSGCSALSDVSIGKGVESIEDRAFYYCNSLTSITIPDTVTSIGNEVFYYCSKLSSVYIGNGISSIGAKTFWNCGSLTSLTIGNSVTSIGRYAFYNCWKLSSVTIPNSVTRIEESAFDSCLALTSITIPDSVTFIGGGAFSDCDKLSKVIIGKGVTNIGNAAFQDCGKLTSITFRGTVSQWNAIDFYVNNWNEGVPATYVQCSDGQVAL